MVSQEVPEHPLVFPLAPLPRKPAASTKVKARTHSAPSLPSHLLTCQVTSPLPRLQDPSHRGCTRVLLRSRVGMLSGDSFPVLLLLSWLLRTPEGRQQCSHPKEEMAVVQEGLKVKGQWEEGSWSHWFQMGEALGAQLLEAREEALGELDPSATKLLRSRWLGEGQGRLHLQWERLEEEERQWDGVL